MSSVVSKSWRLPAISASRGRTVSACRQSCVARAQAVQTPSSAPAANVLQRLEEHTVLLDDNPLDVISTPRDAESSAALVNYGLLSHILANTSAFYEFSNAIEKGLAAAGANKSTEALAKTDIEAAALDQALANVSGMLDPVVQGRIAVEVDPRLSDTDAMVKRATSLVKRLKDINIPASKLLVQLPGTWAGIQAVKQLEAQDINCQVAHVYTFAQAVAAVKAAASVLVLNATHVNLWYDRHPGAIRDPQGPRQDASGVSKVNVGVRTAAAIYTYAQQQGARTKVIAAGLRKPEEVLALSGIDYMIMPSEIVRKLENQSTLQGYNDGFTASQVEDDYADMPKLSDKYVQAHKFRPEEVDDVDEKHFSEELGMAGMDLLQSKVSDDIAAADRVCELIRNVVVARE